MKKLITAILLISLMLLLSACGETSSNPSNPSDSALSIDESSADDNSGKLDESSGISDNSDVESLDISDFTLTTDKAEYGFDDTVTLTLTVNSEHSFLYDDYHYVEYFDVDWKKCEAEFVSRDIMYENDKDANIKFKLSDRADEGKEKYRVVMDVRMSYDTETVFTVYSNEFFAKAE